MLVFPIFLDNSGLELKDFIVLHPNSETKTYEFFNSNLYYTASRHKSYYQSIASKWTQSTDERSNFHILHE